MGQQSVSRRSEFPHIVHEIRVRESLARRDVWGTRQRYGTRKVRREQGVVWQICRPYGTCAVRRRDPTVERRYSRKFTGIYACRALILRDMAREEGFQSV